MLQEKKKPTFAQTFSQGISQGLEKFQELKKQQQERQALSKAGIDPNLPNEFQQLSHQANLKNQQMANDLRGDSEAELRDYQVVKSTFGDKFANLWKAAPVGGKTQLLQYGIQSLERGADLDELLRDIDVPSDENELEPESGFEPQENNELASDNEDISQDEQDKQKEISFEKEFSDYMKKQSQGLTSSEKVARGKERYDSGLKQYQESGEKLRGLARDKERIGILSSLSASKKLPKNLGRLNVDADGNLRAPFLANPETQRFVKTLNEFSASAKDTFGSRVTNFDLQQYLKRFPTLLNTDEGRKQLLQQMEIVNQINSVYYKNLKNVYDKAGGVRNIDADAAERFAEKLSEKQIQKLSSKFKEIGQFSSKPEASEFKGRTIKDKKTGELLTSDGENWIPKGEKNAL